MVLFLKYLVQDLEEALKRKGRFDNDLTRRRDSLIARSKSAEAQKKIAEKMSKIKSKLELKKLLRRPLYTKDVEKLFFMLLNRHRYAC